MPARCRVMASTLIARSLKVEKRSQEICVDQLELGRLEEKADAVEQDNSPRPPPPPPPLAPLLIQQQHQQQRPEAQAVAIKQVVEAEGKGLVDVEKGMALNGEKRCWRLKRERGGRKSRRSNGVATAAAAAVVAGGTTSAWPPPASAEFGNDYSDSGVKLWGEKGWLNGLVVKLDYESNLSCSVGASAAGSIDV